MVDNLAVTSMTINITEARLMAGGINLRAVQLMRTLQQHAQAQRHGLVTAKGTVL